LRVKEQSTVAGAKIIPAEADVAMSAQGEAEPKGELELLKTLLGDARIRFRQRKTPVSVSQQLIDLDLEVRNELARPPDAQQQLEVRRLIARLRALDPH
jgi:hypothetical protein